MTDYQAPLRDMRFVLFEALGVDKQWSSWSSLAEAIDRETANAFLEEAAKLSAKTISPLNRSSDETGCHWENGNVTTPEGFKEAYRLYAESGLTGFCGNPEFGGLGMPKSLAAQFDEMVSSACIAFGLYPSLTSGAALALDAHGSSELKSQFLPNMYSGEWAGTMCLTEAHSGTDLGIIKSKAEPLDNNTYRLNGTKIFITSGEHDLTDNIIHFVLARLPDAPAGSKGISLFLVPKFLVNDDGSLGERNGVSSGSIEHKMGIHGSATNVMHFDNAIGYLVGEPHKGLNAMFTMMNYERLLVGVQGLGASEMSYQTALAYAKDRLQGRSAPVSCPDKVADPIIVHGDVRRMLLNMKALNEAGRAFSSYVAMKLDEAKFSDNPEQQAQAEAMVVLLTPIVKAFLTDMGLETCITGQQVLGGHGYIREWGQEQLVRDVRIAQIYEGTNGIQALDLLGRKVVANNGKFVHGLLNEIRAFIAKNPEGEHNAALNKATDRLNSATSELLQQSKENPNTINASCVEYLHGFAYVVYGWMWAKMAATAKQALQTGSNDQRFYQAKLSTARYFSKRLLPKSDACFISALSGCDALYELSDDQF